MLTVGLLAVSSAMAAPKTIKVFRVGSSSFSYALIEDVRSILEADGTYGLECSDNEDQAGYTRLDRFVQQPGLYEEWCDEQIPRIKKGQYDFVICQTIGWLNFTPDQQKKLCEQILPDLAERLRGAGTELVLYDKYIPVEYEQKDPKAQSWCLRYPEGYRLNYLLHILAAAEGGFNKVSFGGQAVTTIRQDPYFQKHGILCSGGGHPGAMENYISAVTLAYVLTGKDPTGNSARDLPLQGWAGDAFAKLAHTRDPGGKAFYEANRHRVGNRKLTLSDEEAMRLQKVALESHHQWMPLLKKAQADPTELENIRREIVRIQSEMCQYEKYSLDENRVANLTSQFAPAAELGEITPAVLRKVRDKARSISYAGTDVRNFCHKHMDKAQFREARQAYDRYWSENNSKLRDDVYFELRVAELRAQESGDRPEAKRLAESAGLLHYTLSRPGKTIVLDMATPEQKTEFLKQQEMTGPIKRGLPSVAAYQNAHLDEEEALRHGWNVWLEIWKDPNRMDRLKEADFSKDVFEEADREFSQRVSLSKTESP